MSGSSGPRTVGPARGPRPSRGDRSDGGNRTGRGLEVADQPGQSQDMGYERLGEAKLSLDRRHRPVRRLHGTGVLGRVPHPADRRRELVARRGHTAPAVVIAGIRCRVVVDRARSACSHARVDRGAVREADPRRRLAVRLRVGRAGQQRGRGCRVAVLQRHHRAHGRPRRADRRLHPRHDLHVPTLRSRRVQRGVSLPIWAWSAVFALLLFVVLYFGVQISTRVQLDAGVGLGRRSCWPSSSR